MVCLNMPFKNHQLLTLSVSFLWPGLHFINMYEILKFKVYRNHIFQWMGQASCVEFQRYPLKFRTNYPFHATSHYMNQSWLIFNWTTFTKYSIKIHIFSINKCTSKYHLQNDSHFYQASMCILLYPEKSAHHLSSENTLTHYALATQYSNTDLGQHWPR